MSNVVSYEEMLADALDDGTLDADQSAPQGGGPIFDPAELSTDPNRQLGLIYHSYPLLEQFETLQIGGEDALGFSAKLGELLLSPHASCAPPGGDLRVIDGKGACDMLAPGVDSDVACPVPVGTIPKQCECLADQPRPDGFRRPLSYRDGHATISWNDNTRFDQTGACRYASPLYLALDAIGGIDDRIGDDATLEDAYQGARAGVLTNTSAPATDSSRIAVCAPCCWWGWAMFASAGPRSRSREPWEPWARTP